MAFDTIKALLMSNKCTLKCERDHRRRKEHSPSQTGVALVLAKPN